MPGEGITRLDRATKYRGSEIDPAAFGRATIAFDSANGNPNTWSISRWI